MYIMYVYIYIHIYVCINIMRMGGKHTLQRPKTMGRFGVGGGVVIKTMMMTSELRLTDCWYEPGASHGRRTLDFARERRQNGGRVVK